MEICRSPRHVRRGYALSGRPCAIVRVFDQLPQVMRQVARAAKQLGKKSPAELIAPQSAWYVKHVNHNSGLQLL
jgi:hypothetical protein